MYLPRLTSHLPWETHGGRNGSVQISHIHWHLHCVCDSLPLHRQTSHTPWFVDGEGEPEGVGLVRAGSAPSLSSLGVCRGLGHSVTRLRGNIRRMLVLRESGRVVV